jgi:hypothetical protein
MFEVPEPVTRFGELETLDLKLGALAVYQSLRKRRPAALCPAVGRT